MLMAERTSGIQSAGGESSAAVDELDPGEGGSDCGREDLMIDVDDLLRSIDDSPENPPSTSGPRAGEYDGLSFRDQFDTDAIDGNFLELQGFQMSGGPNESGAESVAPFMVDAGNNREASDSGFGGSAGFTDSAENVVLSLYDRGPERSSYMASSPVNPSFENPKEFYYSAVEGDPQNERFGILQAEMPSCTTRSVYTEGDSSWISGRNNDDFVVNFPFHESGSQMGRARGHIASKDTSFGPGMHRLDGNLVTSEEPESCNKSFSASCMDADVSSHNFTSAESTICQSSGISNELGIHHSPVQFGTNADSSLLVDCSQFYFLRDMDVENLNNNEVTMNNAKDETGGFQSDSACSGSEMLMVDYPYLNDLNGRIGGFKYMSPNTGHLFPNAGDGLSDDKALVMPFVDTLPGISKGQVSRTEDGKLEVGTNGGITSHSSKVISNPFYGQYGFDDEKCILADDNTKQTLSGTSLSMLEQRHVAYLKDEKVDISLFDGMRGRFSSNLGHLDSNDSEQFRPFAPPSDTRNGKISYIMDERDCVAIDPMSFGSHQSRVSPESIRSNSSGSKSNADDDSEICILDDISQSSFLNQSLDLGRAIIPLQHSVYGDFHYTGVGGTASRLNNERHILQVALQDLSQPRSEASPPEGLLAIPLLRHQRIALSWMVQKETSSSHCSGGILADDQGLGKTVSTIALILKERATHRASPEVVKKEEVETLNLDEDEDEVTEVDAMKRDPDGSEHTSARFSGKTMNSLVQPKGRLAAGTLVVCPTSVLRQWADELHKKVTREANLSVLVYHGCNRTKDPCELAKYDVVLTTYAIVSMEVPNQRVVDKDDAEGGKADEDMGLVLGKKRKYPPSSGKKGPKTKKGMDSEMLEATARPLAKVAWFRVVLDEAQSIKNHRTQVARACWGLRAKRRWCLSGTPLQNAIDDLYSYFRFLRYDPYSAYALFCSSIKGPIQKNPTKGYKKLQAVLKTIMLRRTKGTLIDGEPIVALPPKVVELKKVDFTPEERDFYTRLEAESRAQFKEYAAAGTVKQNYVNILLMLLRLRQACDHPLLVRDAESNSLGRSSIAVAKKLPQEKQKYLLNCLEVSVALCGICNDPPEDAAVSVCGHVFCNQCISEHLNGDDNQCPTSQCKTRLDASSVFCKATLYSSLSEQPGQDACDTDSVVAVNSYSEGSPFDSSKIRAALEVLQSLARPQDSMSLHISSGSPFSGNVTCPEILSACEDSPNDIPDKTDLVVNNNINDSTKVVGEKAIVFSQWTRMLDLLEARLKQSSIQYRRLDGTMSVGARDKAVKDFNTLPEVTVMIMSLKAASLGLNMVAACHVLLLDLWWNPTTEDQAIDRAHRIGQTRPVTVLRLTVKDTVEDRILALQKKKREMVASAFGEDETGGRRTRLTVEDLNYLFMG